MSEQIIKLKKTELAGFRARLVPDRACTLVLRKDTAYFLEFGDALLRYNSAVLLPSLSQIDSTGIARPGLSIIAAALDYASKHPTKKLLIAGHTDSMGSQDSNVTLSRVRAEAVHGMIAGDREQFARACHGPHLTEEQRYPDGGSGKKKGVLWDDYIDVLNWVADKFVWPCGYPKGNATLWGATVAFQKRYSLSPLVAPGGKGIKESGKFDLATWGAVFDCYDSQLAETLKLDKAGLESLRGKIAYLNTAPDRHFVACGESKPIEAKFKDNYQSQTNRRVEIMFFDTGEEPQLPCQGGACTPAQCWLDDPSHYRLKHLPTEIGTASVATGDLFRFRLHDADANPMPDTFYRFKFPGDADWTGPKQCDGDGWAEIPAPAICPVSNTILVQWEMLNDDEGGDFYVYSRELYIDCASTAPNDGQLRLANLGYDDPDYPVNVRDFQMDYGITESGFGALTKAKLDSIYSAGVCDARRT